MRRMTDEEIKQRVIEQIKVCGESIIENAENIAGDYKYRSTEFLHISFDVKDKEAPEIVAEIRFIPEEVSRIYK